MSTTIPTKCHRDIAVIGMAGRFPGAANLAAFWHNLAGGVESITQFSRDELVAAGVNEELLASPLYVRARPRIEDIDKFDAEFFGISPREAALMDPQQRLFLEMAWEALEDAGCDVERYAGAVGLYAGQSFNSYLLANLCTSRERNEGLLHLSSPGSYQTFIGNDKDFLATRVAYKLNLKGPAMTVQTGCSTSLVAICQACQSLLCHQCDIALAGGTTVFALQQSGYIAQEGGMASPDGHCRAFDVQSQGTVFGSGVGIVVLKRLTDALADNDHIYAVIKGFAVNNDGADKVSYTAPSVDGQADVIALAQAVAGVSADTIQYVEAHGTGTPLGDPIEVAALTQAFRQTTDKTGFCGIGSVKTNIGHLDITAGVAGFIKTCLALKHGLIPPTLHFTQPNPKIDFANSPFYVVAKPTPWTANGTPRRAGVTSLGVGGTNAHVILEEAPAGAPAGPSRPVQLLTLSAKTPAALEQATAQLTAHLQTHPDLNLADVAYTLQLGRRAWPQRRIIVARNAGDLKQTFAGATDRSDPPVVFMFPGQGAQRINMGLELYRTEPVFREAFEQCLRLLPALDLRAALASDETLRQTRFTQPALFAVEYSLAQLWMSWGVRPTAMIGHSVGEYVAACLAGVFTLDDALRVVAERARLVQEQPPGAMVAVRLPEDEVQALLGSALSIAAINAPELCVVAGPFDAIDAFERRLKEKGKASVRLKTSHAFHSVMMDPVVAPMAALLRQIRLNRPQIQYVSTVSAQWVTDADAINPDYWAGHMRQTVRFAEAVARLLADPANVLLEVGPGQTLSTLVRQHPARQRDQAVISSLADEAEQAAMLTALGRLWLAGAPLDSAALFAGERRRRVALPTYPFQRERHWIEPDWGRAETIAVPATASAAAPAITPVPAKSETVADRLRALLAEVAGRNFEAADDQTTFVELGFESLSLTQVTLAIAKGFGVTVAFRELLGDLGTIATLAAHLKNTRPQALPPAALPVGPLVMLPVEPAAADTAPLTEAQREIWLATMRSDAESCAFNQSRTLRLRGPLRREVLERALHQLVQRHDGLRTTFAVEGDMQTVVPHAELTMVVHDFSADEPARRESQLDEILAKEAALPFDLTQAPLLRTQLVKLGEQEHVLVLTAHHIVCDGGAMAVLFHELGELYSAGCRGVPATLPPVRSLLAYARDEVALAAGPGRPAAEAYWLKQFAVEPAALQWPADFSPPAESSGRGARVRLELEPALMDQLRQASAQQGCTLFTFLLSAYYVFLQRLTGQTDLVVAAPVASPCAGGPRALVGHTVNFLAIRAAVNDQARWNEHVQQVKRVVLDAYDHRQVTYGSLLAKLKLWRNRSRLPLVSASFNLTRVRNRLNFAGLEVDMRNNPHRFTNLDLMVDVTDSAGRLEFECVFNTDLFKPTTIQRWFQHFRTLLETVVSKPGDLVAELPLLTAAERRQLLVEWNNTALEFRRDQTMVSLVEEQVARTPNATALVAGTDRLTYAEVNARANQLAYQLRRHGVVPETLVAVCAERAPAMVISLLAILKAGGAYVPVDPAYPKERTAFILADAGAKVLLTQTQLVAELPAQNTVVVNLDTVDLASESRENPARLATAQNLAYLIFTSGSTGRPKGVAIEHRSVVAFIEWARTVFPPAELAGVLFSTSVCFDLSVFELFVTLSCGGTVILAENALHLPTLPAANEVTLINTVPSAMAELVHAKAIPAGVRIVNLAGEALAQSLVDELYGLGHIKKVYDLYGPSEDTTYSTYTLRTASGSANIGRPIANTQAYLLDSRRAPVPIGVPGEILLGGAGLARGYLNRPELTAEKFIPNPFSPEPGARLYRTGDLGRYLPDGRIEYLGRLDRQVKLRGFRIELGEIETVLRDVPEVRDAVTIVREDTPGDRRLVAYLLSRDGALPAAELRSRASAKLPGYMVPAAFVTLDQFPLTPNGKVDRQALPAPERSALAPLAAAVAPRTPVEAKLAGIWCDVLRIATVGMHDNFFELGGHSLLAMQVSSRVREAFGVALPLQAMFEHPSVAALATQLESLVWAQPAAIPALGQFAEGVVEGVL